MVEKFFKGKKRKIIHEGTYVGSIEGTGSWREDLEKVKKLLTDKKIVRQRDRAIECFSLASSFGHAAALLYQPRTFNHAAGGQYLVPFIVNSAFALELYIKALGHSHGVNQHGHDLIKLYDGLPEEARQKLVIEFKNTSRETKVNSLDKFRELLIPIKQAFLEYRYLYEGETACRINFDELIFVTEVFHNTCTKIINRPHKKL